KLRSRSRHKRRTTPRRVLERLWACKSVGRSFRCAARGRERKICFAASEPAPRYLRANFATTAEYRVSVLIPAALGGLALDTTILVFVHFASPVTDAGLADLEFGFNAGHQAAVVYFLKKKV
ncbi:unnamed protein product, partial [Hapterophycus canaliculatus]